MRDTRLKATTHRIYLFLIISLLLLNYFHINKFIFQKNEVAIEHETHDHSEDLHVIIKDLRNQNKALLKNDYELRNKMKDLISGKSHQDIMYEIDVNVVSKLARSFKSMPFSSWCTPENELTNSTPTGILYVRVPKTGSSTIAGVLERIARNYGRSNAHIGKCAIQNNHNSKKMYKYRNTTTSYMIGSLRDPASRAISRVFFQEVSKRGKEPTDENMFDFLKNKDSQIGVITKRQVGFQLEYMSILKEKIKRKAAWAKNKFGKKVLNTTYINDFVESIMNNYEFIFLSERLDECLVALKFLLNLKTVDILYLSSKVSGGSYYRWGNNSKSKCIELQKSFVSPAVGSYLASPDWKNQNYGDYLLYSIVNRSIDLTIEDIGKIEFYNAFDTFKRMKYLASNKCASEATLPCSESGEYQPESEKSCFFEDIGCGHECLDEIR